jgi:RimJ/RimL family protein N-acetyltransferase
MQPKRRQEPAGNFMHHTNHLGQPVGAPLSNWQPPPAPPRSVLAGRFCRLEPLSAAAHAAQLFAAFAQDEPGRMWTYMAYGPFESPESYRDWCEEKSRGSDPLFFAIVAGGAGQAIGVASYLRIDPRNGSIEVGHLAYSPPLQRTPAATEAMFLMMQQAFELGYRRYEWKCHALNAASRTAAERLGFSFEGIFRQATVVKGRNRDTAWYSIIEAEWPALRSAFERWLAPENFDAQGRQRERLSALTAGCRALDNLRGVR